MRILRPWLAAGLAAGLMLAPASAAHAEETPKTTLEARAQLSATHWAEGPESGKDTKPGNGMTPPYPGQVIPGFSAMIELDGGDFYALPDNGFGARSNSADFLLRIYTVHPNWETAETAADPKDVGGVEIKGHIALRDPNKLLTWPIVNGDTQERLLTGADFDPESFVLDKDGSFWIGEEFGPYILHFSADGVLLEAPVPYPGVNSPSDPNLGDKKPTLRNSKGFEAMATDGTHLYPIFEGYLDAATNKRVRVISEFDKATRTYTGRTWNYIAEGDDCLVADAFIDANGQLLVLERDDFWGPEAKVRKVFSVDLKKAQPGADLDKKLIADLLHIQNPGRIGMVSDKDAYGVGEDFSFPFQSVETIVQLRDGRYLTAVDNNFPNNDARYPGKPDNTEMIIFSLGTNPPKQPKDPKQPEQPRDPKQPEQPPKLPETGR